MLSFYRRPEQGGAYQLSSNQAFHNILPTSNYFKRTQSSFDSAFNYIHGIISDKNKNKYESFTNTTFSKLQSLIQKLQPWQKGEVGTFMGLSSHPSSSYIFRLRLQNRNSFSSKYIVQDFEQFITAELAVESLFTGITEVNVAALATIPFFDICKRLDSSSKLFQSYPLGKPTLQNSCYHKGGQLCFLPSFKAGRKHSMERDKHGRWIVVRLNGQLSIKIIIIAYRVCSNTFDLAGNTITDREVQSLLKANHPLWDKPREAFLSDLCNFIKSEQQANRAVFIGGDFNSNQRLTVKCVS